MSLPTRWPLPGALLALALLLLPGILGAQDRVAAPLAEPDNRAQADHLHALAVLASRFVEHPEDRALIARMHGEAARLRDADDPRAYDCFRFQGNLLHQIGKLDEAAGFFEDAAHVARENGKSYLAANALLDAAEVRMEQGRVSEAHALSRDADRLARDRRVTAEERRRIHQRITAR